jgi:hypothetical protein
VISQRPLWPGWRTTGPRGCAGGRPRRRGTPVCDETVTAGCLRNDPVVHHRQRGDHRRVAALLTGHARTQDREARRASRRAPTPSAVVPPGPLRTAARTARRARARSDRDSTGAANGLRRESPIGQREGTRKSCQPRQLAPRAATATDELPGTSKGCMAVARQGRTRAPLAQRGPRATEPGPRRRGDYPWRGSNDRGGGRHERDLPRPRRHHADAARGGGGDGGCTHPHRQCILAAHGRTPRTS